MLATPDPGLTDAPAGWLWVATLIVLGVASLAPLLHRRLARLTPILATLAGLLVLAIGGVVLVGAGSFSVAWGNVLGFAPIAVRYDGLSAVFLLALGLTATAASLSIVGTLRSRAESAVYPLFLASLLLVIGARDAFAFLLAWEAMALTSAFLVVGLRPSRGVISAGYLYLAMTHLATGAILVAFALLASAAGGSLEFAAWRVASPSMDPLLRDAVFVLACIGFGTKAGALPLHAWLPRAHPVAPSHVSALMSGVMIKTGIYGMVRILVDVLGGGPDWWGVVILAAGAVSAVLGVLYALMQHDLKRLLAFHSIENIGIILLGMGAALVLQAHGDRELAALALVAALFHSLNHAAFKGLLFLGAGAVLHATGLRDLNRLGGLGRTMPVVALAFGIGAAAISGLPPLNGFASEWLVFQGLLGVVGSSPVPAPLRFGGGLAVGALALTSALAVACFVKATGVTFLGSARSAAAAQAHDAARPVRLAVGLLALACVALGLGAGVVVGALLPVANGLVAAPAGAAVPVESLAIATPSGASYAPLGVAALAGAVALAGLLLLRRAGAARRVDTWTCGIAPQPAFQYTATSFAKPVRLFFRRLLLPEREILVDYHPGTDVPIAIRYRSEVTLLLEDRVFRPLHGISIRLAEGARRLQGGLLQLYLAYTIVAVLVLLLWAR